MVRLEVCTHDYYFPCPFGCHGVYGDFDYFWPAKPSILVRCVRALDNLSETFGWGQPALEDKLDQLREWLSGK